MDIKGRKKVSLQERCPYFWGYKTAQGKGVRIGEVSSFQGCPLKRGSTV